MLISHKESFPVNDLVLRDMTEDDLPVFFEHQKDPEAVHMAAFTPEDPEDRNAFTLHWTKILGNDSIIKKTIVFNGEIVGHVDSFERDGDPEVTYWTAKEHWGKGLATRSLSEFLKIVNKRPLYGRAAKDNMASAYLKNVASNFPETIGVLPMREGMKLMKLFLFMNNSNHFKK